MILYYRKKYTIAVGDALRGRLLKVYQGKRLPIPFTLQIELDEDRETYPVRDKAKSQE